MTPGFCFQHPTSTLQTKKSTFWRYTWSSGAPTNCWKSKNQWAIGVFHPYKWSYGPIFFLACETTLWLMFGSYPPKKGFTVVSMKINTGSKMLMIRWLFSHSYQGLGSSQSILINGLVIHSRKITAGKWKWGSGSWDSFVGSIIFKFPAVCLRGGVSKYGMRTS